jgi:hypothetical protein
VQGARQAIFEEIDSMLARVKSAKEKIVTRQEEHHGQGQDHGQGQGQAAGGGPADADATCGAAAGGVGGEENADATAVVDVPGVAVVIFPAEALDASVAAVAAGVPDDEPAIVDHASPGGGGGVHSSTPDATAVAPEPTANPLDTAAPTPSEPALVTPSTAEPPGIPEKFPGSA